MQAALRDFQRRADQARKLAKGVASEDAREKLMQAARDYDCQISALEKALGQSSATRP